MKRIFSLRLPLSLLPLLAILTLLSCRSSIRPSLPHPTLHPPSSNSSILLHLASQDPTELTTRKDVENLLQGNFPRKPQTPKLLPFLRQSLRNWYQNRIFHPKILSLLPHQIKTPLDRHNNVQTPSPCYPSCAVVGNSGILLNSNHGALIDSHHLVIRLNNARTFGYQRDVGSKTDLSFVNSNILHLCARRPGCFCHPYGPHVPILMYICQPAHFADYASCNSSHKAPLLITDIRFDMLCGRIVKYYSLRRFAEVTGRGLGEWGRAHDEKMFHYSSGMQAVMLAVGVCDRVGVFGFGKAEGAKHHYHTNQKGELDLHDYDAEYAFYEDLVGRPGAIPFVGGSGFVVPPVVFYH